MEQYVLGYNQSEDFKTKFKKLIKQRKFKELFSRGIIFFKHKILREKIQFFFYRLFHKKNTFMYNNKTYKALITNKTFYNERMIEIPIFKGILKQNRGKKILEVGNVMHNFMNTKHDVLDKYEVSKGVINEDIITYNPQKKYDLVISVSTLEHVGWDEIPKNPSLIFDAIKNLKKITKKDGEIIFSIPWNYNTFFDKIFLENKIGFTNLTFLKKNKKDVWLETTLNDLKKVKFNFKVPCANALVICTIKN